MSRRRRDHGWAWVVLASSFFIYVLVFGISGSNGIVYAALLDTFGQSHSQTTWVTFILQSCLNLFSPLAGYVGRKVSYRFIVMVGGFISCAGLVLSFFVPSMEYLYVTYGVILGFGFSCAIAPTAIITGLYFERRRALANGVCFAGSGVGAFLVPPLIEWLRTEYGLRGTFLVVGGVVLNIVTCASLFRREPPIVTTESPVEMQVLNDATTKAPLSEEAASVPTDKMEAKNGNVKPKNGADAAVRETLLSNGYYAEETHSSNYCRPCRSGGEINFLTRGMFLLVAFDWSMIMFSLASCVLIVPSFASLELKIAARTESAFLISAVAAGDIFGRLGFGWLIDLKLFPNKFACMTSLWSAGLMMISISQATSYWALVACCVCYGISIGSSITLHPLLLIDYLGLRGFQRSFGFVGFFAGIVIFALSPLIGFLRDVTGSYQSSLCLAGSLVVIMGMLWLAEPLIVRWQPLPKDAEILKTRWRYCNTAT